MHGARSDKESQSSAADVPEALKQLRCQVFEGGATVTEKKNKDEKKKKKDDGPPPPGGYVFTELTGKAAPGIEAAMKKWLDAKPARNITGDKIKTWLGESETRLESYKIT